MAEFWRTYSAYTSGYQSVDHLSDIDEFEESFKYLSVVDKTKHYYTLCKTGSPLDTPAATPKLTPKRVSSEQQKELQLVQQVDEGIEEEDEVLRVEEHEVYDEDDVDVDQSIREAWKEIEEESASEDESVEFEGECEGERSSENELEITRPDLEDVQDGMNSLESELQAAMVKQDEEKEKEVEEQQHKDNSNSKAEDKDHELDNAHGIQQGLHYRAGDEPEPIDLTHLNIEAAMMCLASKVRVLCGRANSPTLSSRTFRFRELDSVRNNTSSTPPPTSKNRRHDEISVGIPKSTSHETSFKIPDVPNPNHEVRFDCLKNLFRLFYIRVSMKNIELFRRAR